MDILNITYELGAVIDNVTNVLDIEFQNEVFIVNAELELYKSPIPHNYGLITWNGSSLTVS